MPILPHYVDLSFVDLKNTVPDNASFLDAVNGDISAVLHVPRVSMGQERGSTFAATFNANQWSVRVSADFSQSWSSLCAVCSVGTLNSWASLTECKTCLCLSLTRWTKSHHLKPRDVVMAHEAITTLAEARDMLGMAPEEGSMGQMRYQKGKRGTPSVHRNNAPQQ